MMADLKLKPRSHTKNKTKQKKRPASRENQMKGGISMISNTGDFSTINPRWSCSWCEGDTPLGRRTRGLTD